MATKNNLTKHTLFLRQGDMGFLRDHFPRLGASEVIRRVVSKFVDRLDRPIPDDQLQELMKEETTTND